MVCVCQACETGWECGRNLLCLSRQCVRALSVYPQIDLVALSKAAEGEFSAKSTDLLQDSVCSWGSAFCLNRVFSVQAWFTNLEHPSLRQILAKCARPTGVKWDGAPRDLAVIAGDDPIVGWCIVKEP